MDSIHFLITILFIFSIGKIFFFIHVDHMNMFNQEQSAFLLVSKPWSKARCCLLRFRSYINHSTDWFKSLQFVVCEISSISQEITLHRETRMF